jgi:hypothetical protein
MTLLQPAREALRKAAAAVAERRLGTTQPNAWRIEHQDDVLLSTLRSHVEALGGRLELRAAFDDKTVDLEAREAPS